MWREHGHPLQENVKKYKKNGQIQGCGYNATGALGLGHKNVDVSSLTRLDWFVDKGIFIKDLDIGEYHVISLDDEGKVYC